MSRVRPIFLMLAVWFASPPLQAICNADTCYQPDNGVGFCRTGACTFSCDVGYKVCGRLCIPTESCCSAADCPAPANGSAVCSSNSCTIACAAGFQACGGACIANGSCCTNAQCPTTNGTQTCSASHTCTAPLVCNAGFKSCNGACIPNSQCCTNADCPVPNGTGTCNAGTCQLQTCNANYKFCATSFSSNSTPINPQCIPSQNCCTDSDCPYPPGSNTACTNGTCTSTCPAGTATCVNPFYPGIPGNPGLPTCMPTDHCCTDSQCPGPVNGSGVCMAVETCGLGLHNCSMTSTCIPDDFICNPGFQPCNGACIANSECCTNAQCTLPGGNGTNTCIGKNCVPPTVCDSGYKLCGGACISDSQCCTDADCAVTFGTGACTAGSCVATSCQPGFTTCGGVCLGSGRCCTNSDCAASAVSNGTSQCVSYGCQVSCNAGFQICNGSCISTAACCSTTD